MARRGAGTPFLLQLSLLLLLHLGGTLGCASVAVGSPIVPLGSAVTASCTIQRELCRGLEQGKVRIIWMLDNKLVAGSQRQGPGGTEVSNLTLPRFNHTQARLWCCVEWNGTKQRIGMAEIRAGYPPAKPLNLSCVLNLSDYGLTCRWEQGTDSHLPTSIVLKCAGSRAQVVTGCTPQGGHSHCTVPRRLLQLYRQMEIWVSATNALGTAESEHLCIDPMDVAKLDPPTLQSIQSIPFQTDCIALAWDVARGTEHMELQCELRYRAPEDPAWVLVSAAGAVGPGSSRDPPSAPSKPGHCSACWQMDGDGAATTALIQGKRGLPGDPDPLVICPRGLAPILTKPGPSPGPSPPPTLPPSSGSTPRVGGLVPWGTGRGSRGGSPNSQPPLLSVVDGIEPFQLYNISLYPLYEDTVGVPIHTTAYSLQKAPSYAPKLHLRRISKSEAELCWEPLPVDMQNGFITSYTIFWANSIADVASATVNPSLSSFVIRGLRPSTLYKVHIMASTWQCPLQFPVTLSHFPDDTEIQFLFLTLGLIFVLFMVLLICFQKNER
ncbi:Granulocyte colony-stimulating factor receptor [Corvus brachyrhynchos]|uniref:Granulocyte colony-stimulating factor receptor n=1 Tax=Corvus brachyrhynchos TaxID=85066 RepID=A0A091EVB2_CORBR|nr:Granulocyte colony-stimulating factor receptor [Corvus brachyrhynchos]